MKYGFCSVLGGKPPGFSLSGSILSPYGDKLTDITTFPQTKNVDGGSIMDEIQMKWKRNANRTQFGRKFRAKPTRKGRKKAPFVGLWENGAKKTAAHRGLPFSIINVLPCSTRCPGYRKLQKVAGERLRTVSAAYSAHGCPPRYFHCQRVLLSRLFHTSVRR